MNSQRHKNLKKHKNFNFSKTTPILDNLLDIKKINSLAEKFFAPTKKGGYRSVVFLKFTKRLFGTFWKQYARFFSQKWQFLAYFWKKRLFKKKPTARLNEPKIFNGILTCQKFKKVEFAQKCPYTTEKISVNKKTKCSPTSALWCLCDDLSHVL